MAIEIKKMDMWLWDNRNEGLYVDCTVNYNTPNERRIKFSFKGDNTLWQWKAVNCSIKEDWREYYDALKNKYRQATKQAREQGIELRLSKGFANVSPKGRQPVRSLMMLMATGQDGYGFILHLGKDKFEGEFDRTQISEKQAQGNCLGKFAWRSPDQDADGLEWF